MIRPSNNPITLPFGATTNPYSPSNPHKGVDYGWRSVGGAPDLRILAPFSGKVVQAYNDRDGNGSYMTDPQGRFHGMLHASSYTVPNGAIVTEGQQIAVMGATGAADGVHCHWAVKENGQFINGEALIQGGNMSKDSLTPEENNVLGWLATGIPGQSHPVFKNNAENPLSAALANYQGYTETRNLHLDVEDYRSGRLQNRIKQLEQSEQDLAQAVVDRDKKIAALEMGQGEDSEPTIIGKALIKLFQSFGYKKG